VTTSHHRLGGGDVGRASRRKKQRREEIFEPLALPRFEGSARIVAPGAKCPACESADVHFLSTSIGLLRCDCGCQWLPLIADEAGRGVVPVPEEESTCPARVAEDGTIEIDLSLGPVQITTREVGIFARHDLGDLAYSSMGHLLWAAGMFCREHLMAPNPSPCVCGSLRTTWVDGAAAQPLITDFAERMGRKVIPHRCEGKVWLEIEGFGGRAARCLDCDAKAVFPTIFGGDEEYRAEMERKHQSVFVSYGGPDEEFATRLVHELTKKGVKTWFFPRDALPGEKLHREMFRGVNQHDRILLICSRSSLNRSGVLNEIERVLEREAREGGTTRLLPISLDDYVYSEWAPDRPDLAGQVRSRVICNFQEAAGAGWTFHEKIDQLVRALSRPT
jgi:hypothetical protein